MVKEEVTKVIESIPKTYKENEWCLWCENRETNVCKECKWELKPSKYYPS